MAWMTAISFNQLPCFHACPLSHILLSTKGRVILLLFLFSLPVASDSLRPHGLQHATAFCPSPSPKAFPSSCPLNWQCHPSILFSNTLFFCPQSFWASGTFPMSQLLSSGDQNIRVSASSISPFKECSGLIFLKIDWFDFLAVQGTFRSLFQLHSLKASILWYFSFFMVQLSEPYMTTGKT